MPQLSNGFSLHRINTHVVSSRCRTQKSFTAQQDDVNDRRHTIASIPNLSAITYYFSVTSKEMIPLREFAHVERLDLAD